MTAAWNRDDARRRDELGALGVLFRGEVVGATDQLKSLIAEVEKVNEGAFAPLGQQPFVRAALLPLSGAGGIAAIEYLLLGH